MMKYMLTVIRFWGPVTIKSRRGPRIVLWESFASRGVKEHDVKFGLQQGRDNITAGRNDACTELLHILMQVLYNIKENDESIPVFLDRTLRPSG